MKPPGRTCSRRPAGIFGVRSYGTLWGDERLPTVKVVLIDKK